MDSHARIVAALNDLQCAEAYHRTVIACDEVRFRTSKSIQLHGQPSLLWRDAPSRTLSSAEQVTTSSSCGMCCNHREMAVGICRHADDALATVKRQKEFMEFYQNIDRRIRLSGTRIRRSGSGSLQVNTS